MDLWVFELVLLAKARTLGYSEDTVGEPSSGDCRRPKVGLSGNCPGIDLQANRENWEIPHFVSTGGERYIDMQYIHSIALQYSSFGSQC